MRSLGLAAIFSGGGLLCLFGAISLLIGDETTTGLPWVAAVAAGAAFAAGIVLVAFDALVRRIFRPRPKRFPPSRFETAGQPMARAKHWEQQWPPPLQRRR